MSFFLLSLTKFSFLSNTSKAGTTTACLSFNFIFFKTLCRPEEGMKSISMSRMLDVFDPFIATFLKMFIG